MLDRKQIIDKILPTSQFGYHFRLVEVDDAEFILSLRTHAKLSRYINATSDLVEEQIKWLKAYKKREQAGEDFYIMCLKEDGTTKLGLNRIYDIKATDFEFGSWVYLTNAGANASILGDLFVKSLAFEQLGFKTARLSVRKENKRVLWYTKSFNPTIVDEDELSYFFELVYDNFKEQRDNLLKMLNIE
jgi:hypothetical protein